MNKKGRSGNTHHQYTATESHKVLFLLGILTSLTLNFNTYANESPQIGGEHPLFQYMPVTHSISLSTTPKLQAQEDSSKNNSLFRIAYEYAPHWVQPYGVLKAGPTLAYLLHATKTVEKIFVGLKGTYEFRYFREQPLVPYVSYTYEVKKSSSLASQKNTTHTSFSMGGAILLNFFDSDDASSFFANYGVLRTYLFVEKESQTFSPAMLSKNENIITAGIAFEL